MTSITLSLPEFLTMWQFWAGFGAGIFLVVAIVVAFLLYCASNFRPF